MPDFDRSILEELILGAVRFRDRYVESFLFPECQVRDMLTMFILGGDSMLTFFHGWRRKMGVATLVAACVLAGLWIRSFCCGDEIEMSAFESLHSFGSESGQLSWWKLINPPSDFGSSLHFVSGNSSLSQRREGRVAHARLATLPLVYTIDLIGPVHQDAVQHKEPRATEAVIPHWVVVLPLTLLSAYLLLVNPRPKANQLVPHA